MRKASGRRWIEITPSEYAWEREALDYLKTRFPDADPFRAWSNFEFIAHDGSINEVDLLVVSLHYVFLVEIKSWRGVVSGDQSTWRRTVEGRTFLTDSPLLLANRKAKKLAALLKAQPALARLRAPFLEPLVFLSQARRQLEGLARTGVYLSENHAAGEPAIVDVLRGAAGFDPRRPPPRIDPPLSRAIARAMEQAGIRPSQRQRQVSDYVLRRLLLETDAWQDWEAQHVAVPESKRRVRIYPWAGAPSAAGRAERRAAAEREYRLLDGVNHDGILRAELLTVAEQGPAIVFEHDPAAERLDHFLDRRGAGLPPETRLGLVRQLAETVQYAHERRLYHRALSPRRVLVMDPDAERPRAKIFDWQTAAHGANGASTLHPAGDDADGVYLAPESRLGGYDPQKLDIFSLGAIAYRIFAGAPPAPTVAALHDRLAGSRGLMLSDQVDGAPEALQLVVACVTDPDASARPDSAEFRSYLDKAERELAAAREPREKPARPLDARPDDRLEGGFQVKRRLGRGATALALQVEHEEDGGGVLKVALDPARNDHVRREGRLLRSLRHANIVQAYREVDLSGHAAVFMALAGARTGAESRGGSYTLADRIREEGRLSLDLLQRFGDQLMDVVQWLEEHGVSHRDLKPDNIGVSGSPLSLVVFDFSLADTPADNIRAGTPQYRDPFLPLRTPPRWDAYAERFSAAMTLHEMATGQLPGWGDGQSDPALLDEEVSLDAESFDPSVREALTEFFRTALARDYRARFDNAEEMRRAWFRCFEAIDVTASGDENGDLPEEFDGVTEATSLADLGVSPRLLNALERIGAHTVAELIALPRIRLYRNKGIGQRIVKRIRALSERLAEHLAERGRAVSTTTGGDAEYGTAADPAAWSIDLLASRLGRGTPAGGKWMTPLRDSVAALVEQHGGVMTREELAAALAAARGSAASGSERLRRAGVVAAAALEAERKRRGCRFVAHPDGAASLILATPALDPALTAAPEAQADYVRRLGQAADRLAGADPLASPARVREELAEVGPPPGMAPLAPDRRLRVAVLAAERAALSSRGELYPRGMPAERAVKLGASSLLGPKELNARQLRERLAGRYPEAEPLPDHPRLDALLDAAGLKLVWDRERATYRAPTPHPTRSTGSTSSPAGDGEEEAYAADALDDRLRRTIGSQGFLALSVPARYFAHVERYLAGRFALAAFRVEAELIRHMRALAAELGADWNVVLAADAAPSGSVDHRRLDQLVGRAAARLQDAIAGAEAPLLLTRSGLLARYRRLDLLAAVQDECQRGAAAAARVLCIAGGSADGLPVIDRQALPVVVASAWARPGAAWLTRAAGTA